MKDILVIYHGRCTDGFGSAYSAWKKLKNTADYLPVSHGEDAPDVTGKTVYILDFSFKKEIYFKLLKTAKEIILLDHHKTALDNLDGCPGCYFDLNRSGAMIAWNYFNPDIPAPKFIQFIQDGDLWRFKFPETKFFYRGINAIEHDFLKWQHFENEDYLNNIVKEGMIIEKFYQSQILDVAKNAIPVEIFGEKGLMINANGLFSSELGNHLSLISGTYALIWYQSDTVVKCSLRSVANYDCSTIAQKMGGGGHPQACGFIVPHIDDLFKIIGQK